eukprot:TRINITY_DN18131_c0_g1_i1.p1 TRINITY_DN18131_c0_g1~~TRINITY_DN18131_c0_g1_i1.p1  ORF type:complete len:629 (-),score=163.66 TRINITY_DN18131_c0_g1_i1:184-2070(-)
MGDSRTRRGSQIHEDIKYGVEPEHGCAKFRWQLQQVLEDETRRFDLTMGFVIIVNAIVIGVEQQFRLKGEGHVIFDVTEQVFLLIYIGELLIRFAAYGVGCFMDVAVIFDLLLVLVSIAVEWVMKPFFPQTQQNLPVMVFRLARLARLARSLRLLIKFRELWMLVQGLLASANTIMYTLVLIAIMMYVFGSVGVELITLKYQDPERRAEVTPEFLAIVDYSFSSLSRTMLTLLQFTCMDDIAQIYVPMMEQDWVLSIYFGAVILVISIVLMNIITAVLVNGALEQATQDKEALRVMADKRKRKLMKSLREMFKRLDGDSSGAIDKNELLQATGEEAVLLTEFMTVADPVEIFNMLDIDGGGTLDIDEFCEGLYQAAVTNTPVELKRIDKRVDAINNKTATAAKQNDAIIELVNDTMGAVRALHHRLDGIERHLGMNPQSFLLQELSSRKSSKPIFRDEDELCNHSNYDAAEDRSTRGKDAPPKDGPFREDSKHSHSAAAQRASFAERKAAATSEGVPLLETEAFNKIDDMVAQMTSLFQQSLRRTMLEAGPHGASFNLGNAGTNGVGVKSTNGGKVYSNGVGGKINGDDGVGFLKEAELITPYNGGPRAPKETHSAPVPDTSEKDELP